MCVKKAFQLYGIVKGKRKTCSIYLQCCKNVSFVYILSYLRTSFLEENSLVCLLKVGELFQTFTEDIMNMKLNYLMKDEQQNVMQNKKRNVNFFCSKLNIAVEKWYEWYKVTLKHASFSLESSKFSRFFFTQPRKLYFSY